MSSFSSTTAWGKLIYGASPAVALRQAVLSAATRMSIQLGHRLSVDGMCVKLWLRAQLDASVAQLGGEAVAVYLQLGDGLPGQAVLIASVDHARRAAAWMLDTSPAEHDDLGELERAALAELGDLAVSALMNTLALLTSLVLRPPPPAVLVDTIGVVFDLIAASVDDDRLTVVVVDFVNGDHALDLQLWLIPDRVSNKKLSQK